MAAGRGAVLARGGHERVDPTVPVVSSELTGKLGVELKAAARERSERRVVAPVEREEPSGLAGRGTRDARPLHERDGDPAACEEVCDRGADDAGAADDHVPGD